MSKQHDFKWARHEYEYNRRRGIQVSIASLAKKIGWSRQRLWWRLKRSKA